MLEQSKLPLLLEAILLAAGKPLSEDALMALFEEGECPSKGQLRQALQELQNSCEDRGICLMEFASGYQFQVKSEWAPWVSKLWEEKAPRYSRALLETLALIAYRQPITRGEIEDIRGVSLSPSIFKTLLEDREWIRIVGHREVPGRPGLYATTRAFLDYFGLKSLEELPSLPEIMDLGTVKMSEEFSGKQLSLEMSPLVEEVETAETVEATETIETTETAETFSVTEEQEAWDVRLEAEQAESVTLSDTARSEDTDNLEEPMDAELEYERSESELEYELSDDTDAG